jgi:YafQ family addiction module toxin component
MQDPYDIEIGESLQKKIKKLENKNSQSYKATISKIIQIAEAPQMGKPLRGILKGKRRVHIGPFVLIYMINDADHTVTFIELAHHDTAYRY